MVHAHMKQFTLLALVFLILSACLSEQKNRDTGKPNKIITDTLIICGTVVAIDYHTRMVTLRDGSGTYVTFRVDREVKNLDRIQKGDQAVATYIESIGLRIDEPGCAGGDVGMKGEVIVDVGLKGEKPYSVTARIVELRAVVDTINHRTRHISIRGRKGNIISFRVRKNIEKFENVNRGDIAVIYYTEAIAILLEKIKEGN
jgi:hypothetical protein